MRRIISVMCAVALCVMLTACTATPSGTPSADPTAPTTDTQIVDGVMRLVFNREDTLNPYTTKTATNLYLSTLLYQSLFTPDKNFAAKAVLADTASMTDPTHLSVTLKAGVLFSDGAVCGARDVQYSFQKAKNSANYSAALANFTAVAVKGETLTFTLSVPDAYATACLYFPIVKRDTGDAALPTGCGNYTYDAENEMLKARGKSRYQTVQLCHYTDGSAMLQGVQNGSISYLYDDLSDGNIPRTSAKQTAVDLPQLVFLGINHARGVLGNATVRAALSAAIDRTAIASSSYAGRAHAATSPFPPTWQPAQTVAVASATVTRGAADLMKKALAGAVVTSTAPSQTAQTGAPTTAATTAATIAQTTAAWTLIYPAGGACREAAVKNLVKQFALVGVTLTPVPLDYAAYTARLAAGDFDLYLGEIRLTPNMSLTPFLTAGGSTAYGINIAGDTAQKYMALRRGEIDMTAFAVAFTADMPYIPICWRQGIAMSDAAVTNMTPTAYAVYDGMIS